MLRAKPILTFSGYARSILLNGPRFGAADGATCQSGDADSYTSVEPRPQNAKYLGFPGPEKRRPTRTEAVLRPPEPEPRTLVVPEPVPEPATVFSDPLFKAGVAAVGLLSDLVNRRPPSSEWGGPKYMVGPAPVVPRSMTGPKIKPVKSESTRTEKYPPGCVKESGSRASVRKQRDGKIPDRVSVSGRRAGGGRVVEKVCRVLREARSGPAAEAALGTMSPSMDAYQANQVLKRLQDCSVALGLFRWLRRQPGFEHDGHTYTTMVGILGRARRFDEVDRLLAQMAGDGFRPNVVTFNRLIHSHGRADNPKEAAAVFDRMIRAGVDPDRVTYCTLIDAHAKAGLFDSALTLYRSMLDAGLSPDAFTYGVMIDCLGKAGRPAAARSLFSEMAGRGCAPNLVTYNIMLALQTKARDFSAALALFRDMKAAGVEPDLVSYSIMMAAMGRRGRPEEAEAVFSEMRRNEWVPDEAVFGQMVDMWGRAGDVERARGWHSAMLSAGLRPNVPACNSLLGALLRAGRTAEARALVRDMLGSGLAPTLQTYTLLLGCCAGAGGAGVGFFGELMGMTGHPAHALLLAMPGAEGDLGGHVCVFLEAAAAEGRASRRAVVDAVVDFLHRAGMKEEAGCVWDAAAERGVYPEAVTERRAACWMVDLHLMSEGTAVTALSRALAGMRARMLGSGAGPSRVDIVTGWGRRSRVAGTSLVRRAVSDLLCVFGFPFSEGGNSGCFVGCGEGLTRWLASPFVERMHLL